MGEAVLTGVHSCAQDEGKDKQRQRLEQKQIPFGDDKQKLRMTSNPAGWQAKTMAKAK
jgi:hypothetical protein